VALVKLKVSLDNFYALRYFGLVAIDAVMFLLVCVGGMISPYLESKKVLQTLNTSMHTLPQYVVGAGKHSHRWLKRYIRSLSLIKVMIGDSNFLEERTALRCVDVSITLAVNFLLLLSSGK